MKVPGTSGEWCIVHACPWSRCQCDLNAQLTDPRTGGTDWAKVANHLAEIDADPGKKSLLERSEEAVAGFIAGALVGMLAGFFIAVFYFLFPYGAL